MSSAGDPPLAQPPRASRLPLPPVETCRAAALREDEVESIIRMHQLAWDRTGDEPLEAQVRWRLMRYRDPDSPQRSDQLMHRLFAGGVLAATALSFRRTIAAAHGPFEVLALAGVATHPLHRGRGCGEAVVRAALARLDGSLRVCYFQTAVPGFYEQLGARAVRNPVVNRADDARCFWEEHVMIWPASADWPSGEIDLRGEAW